MYHPLTDREVHLLTTLFGADFWHLARLRDSDFRIALRAARRLAEWRGKRPTVMDATDERILRHVFERVRPVALAAAA